VKCKKDKGNDMWIVQYKSSNDSQPWFTSSSSIVFYDNKESALICASWAAIDHFMVRVTGSNGNVIWSN
jgi:hypothetical protein